MFRNLRFHTLDCLEVFRACDAGQRFPPHYHETFCVSLIEKGALLENETVAAQNSLLISNPFEVHTNSILPTVRYSLTTFYISQEVVRFAGRTKHDFCLPKVVDDPPLFQQLQYVADQFFAIREDEQASKTVEQAFLRFLSQLSGYALPSEARWADEPTWLQASKDYITRHFAQKLELATLAHLAGVEKYQFIRSFKKHVGLTPFQFLILTRVVKGKEMLAQGRPVVDTALEVGFYDQSHFTNYFKRYVGDTPHVFRRSCNMFQENN